METGERPTGAKVRRKKNGNHIEQAVDKDCHQSLIGTLNVVITYFHHYTEHLVPYAIMCP